MKMQKYLQIMKATWGEYMVYRLNFVLWRVRMVMQILVVYFLWWAIFSEQKDLFGYTQSMILTYVLLSNIVRTIILGTTTIEVGSIINQGNLTNFLLRPINFFRYYIARDAADKGLNFLFAVVELTLLFLLLAPPLFIQTNPGYIVLFAFAITIGVILYFFFSMTLSFLGFWTPEAWAPRFLSFVIMEFLAGGMFPLDILPQPLFTLSQSLPFSYFIYFPLKVYLGQLGVAEILRGFALGILWLGGMWYIAWAVWRKGLRFYTAEGR